LEINQGYTTMHGQPIINNLCTLVQLSKHGRGNRPK